MALSNYSPSASLNTSISGINIGEGMERDEVNNALRQIMADVAPLGGSASGTLQSGSTNAVEVARTFNGAADGTSQFYGQVHRIYAQGSNNIDYAREGYRGTHIQGSGTVANADGVHQYVWGEASSHITNAKVINAHLRFDASSVVSSEAYYYRATSVTLGIGATVAAIKGYSSGDIGGAGVTNAYAFDADDFTAGTVSVGFRSQLNTGANKFAFFGAGTAASAFGGFVGIGMTSTALYQLQVVATAANYTASLDNSHASNPSGLRIRYTASAPNNSTNEFIICTDSGATRFAVASSGVISVAGLPVVGARKTGTAANATDLATAIALVNDLKAKLVSHGLIS